VIGRRLGVVDRRVLGEFKWSSQLDRGELRWARGEGGGRIGLAGRRCGHRDVRRRGGRSTASGSGRRSPVACRARPRRPRRACRPRLASGGFGRVAGCRRSPWARRRGVTCRSAGGRRSLFFARVVAACGRSRGRSGVRRRRSRGSCVAMPRPVAVGSSIGRARRSGMATVAAGVRSRPSSR
jgi:hypothetical protein